MRNCIFAISVLSAVVVYSSVSCLSGVASASNGSMSGIAELSTTRHYDLLELNHYHDPQTGLLGFSQIIFWDWCPQYRRYNAHGFAIVDDNTDATPVRVRGKWEWRSNKIPFSADGNAMRAKFFKVTGDLFRETRTDFDPERDSKRLFPEKYR